MWPQEPDHVRARAPTFAAIVTLAWILALCVAAAELQTLWRAKLGGPRPADVTLSGSTTPPADLYAALATSPRDAIGRSVPFDVPLLDSDGASVRLGDLAAGRPLAVVLAWYRCPMLCGLVGAGLGELRSEITDLPWSAVTISFDPQDGPGDAVEARARDGADWPYVVVADDERLTELTSALAFDARLEPTGQWRHPAALYVLTSEGRVAAVVPGVRPDPAEMRRALREAQAGRVVRPADSWIDTCLRWDPASRMHGGVVLGWLRAGAAVSVVALAALVLALMRMRP